MVALPGRVRAWRTPRSDHMDALRHASYQPPAAPVSERLRRAGLRLFGSEDATSAAITRLWQQQALLQIYDDFCMQDASDCVRCPFPEQVAGSSS